MFIYTNQIAVTFDMLFYYGGKEAQVIFPKFTLSTSNGL